MRVAKAGHLLNAGDVRTYETIEHAFAVLENEVIEGVIYDLPAAQKKVDESDGALDLVEVIPTGSRYGIALPKDIPLIEPVNKAPSEIKEDGTYDKIYKKWIGRPRRAGLRDPREPRKCKNEKDGLSNLDGDGLLRIPSV